MTTSGKQSVADQLFETKYQSRVASELWLRLAGKDYRLVGKLIRLGRALDNDIVLEDKSCSRYHAQIVIEGSQILIEDLKSRNGIKVNGKMIGRSTLTDQTKIEIGDLEGEFYFKRKKGEAAPKSQVPEEFEVTGAGREERSFSESTSALSRLIQYFQNIPPKMRLLLIGAAPLVLFAVFILTASFLSLLSGPGDLPKPQAKVFEEACLPENRVLQEVSGVAFGRCVEYEDLGNFRRAKACLRELPFNDRVCTALNRVIRSQKAHATTRFTAGQQAMQFHYYEQAIVNFQEVLLTADEGSELSLKAIQALQDAERNLMRPRR